MASIMKTRKFQDAVRFAYLQHLRMKKAERDNKYEKVKKLLTNAVGFVINKDTK